MIKIIFFRNLNAKCFCCKSRYLSIFLIPYYLTKAELHMSKSISRRRFLAQTTAAGASFFIVPRYVLGGPGYTPPSDQITLGFIGTGRQSGGLGKRFMDQAGAQIIAACDVYPAKLEKFRSAAAAFYQEKTGQTNHNGCATYNDYEDLLAHKDLDAVVVVLPDHWHAKASIDAMKAGKDVFCEKPLAHTVAEGRAMANAVKKYNKVLQTGSMQRSSHNFRHAVELVWNGYIGEIQSIKVNVGDPAVPCDLPDEPTPAGVDWNRWLGGAHKRGFNAVLAPLVTDTGWPMWRKYREFGGGILCDWGAHMFDISQWMLNMDHSGPVKFTPPQDKTAVRGLVMEYANGIKVTHEDFGRSWAVQVNGSKGKIEVSRSFLESDIPNLVDRKIGATEKRVYFSDNHYADWLDAIKKRSKPICDVETGHRSASVCNLANIAYQLGRPLSWDPAREVFAGDAEADELCTKKYRRKFKLPKV